MAFRVQGVRISLGFQGLGPISVKDEGTQAQQNTQHKPHSIPIARTIASAAHTS